MRGVSKCLHPVLKEAERMGYRISYTRGGHIKCHQTGYKTVFMPLTPSDSRSVKNCMAHLRQSYRKGVIQ